MINKLIKGFQEIDEPILKFIHKGLRFSTGICLISLLILILHITYPISFTSFYSSLLLFRAGITFAVGFFVCGFVVDNLRKQFS